MKLTIELLYKCPLNCSHCSSVHNESFLTLPQIKAALKTQDFKEVILSGGEPFIHPRFREIVTFLLRNSYQVSINTCGLSNRIKYRYFSFEKSFSNPMFFGVRYEIPFDLLIHFNKVYVSLYGDRYIHNHITREESFNSTFHFINLMSLFFSRIYGPNHERVIINTPIFWEGQINHLINSLTYYDFPHVPRLYFPIHFIRLLKYGRASDLPVLLREKQLEIALRVKSQYPKDTITISESLSHKKCNWKTKFTLLPDGRLIHCVAGKLHANPNQEFICDKIC